MIYDEIERYIPENEQEERDKALMLSFIRENEDAFLRTNELAHFTASSWIVNEDMTRVLMVYHNIYNSWSWTGGHADGEKNLLSVAVREAMEETGIKSPKAVGDIFSLETITVDGHKKRGKYVSSHLHLNVTYLITADENDELFIKPDENSSVKWFSLEDALKASTEPWMVERIYKKLNNKLKRESHRLKS